MTTMFSSEEPNRATDISFTATSNTAPMTGPATVQIELNGIGEFTDPVILLSANPTNGIVGNRDLIRVAVVRDPRQAMPLVGTWVGAASDSLGIDVDVTVAAGSD